MCSDDILIYAPQATQTLNTSNTLHYAVGNNLRDVLFIFRLLQYIDGIIADHKEKLLLNSDKVLAGEPHALFNTVYIDR